jgi:hypothetical protein
MICPPCRSAGNYLVAVDLSYDFTDEGDIEQAGEEHAKCKGGTWCDCQHLTEPLVRRQNA